MQVDGLEDRLFWWLAQVPRASIERELAMIAPGCQPQAMSVADVVRVLGVSGIASLAGVRRSTVLEAAGPESCQIADLIEPNPYGHLVGNASCSSCACSGEAWGPSSFAGPGARVPLGGGFASPTYYASGAAASASPSAPIGYATGAVASYGLPARGYARNPVAGQEVYPTDQPIPIDEPFVEPSGPAPGGGFSGWPGAVPFREGAWNFDEGWYILQADDTFSGLAATYLGSPARYMEIWSLQPYRYTKAIDPSSVTPTRPLVKVGERVIMPQEAVERARELVRTGAPSAPAIGGTGGNPQGKGAPWSTGTKVALGLGALAVLGVGAYAVSS